MAMPNQEGVFLTEECYNQLVDELEELKTVKRNEISEKIRVARGFGDLSENSEYDEAKNEQALVEARINQLEIQLKTAQVLKVDNISTDTVSVGTKVTIYDMEFEEETTCRIVSPIEANSSMDTITDESPVGKALLGHKAGDVVDVHVNGNVIQYKILSISR